uniref:Uncharacterized protein n=1 Tax=Arundo donax TaxID=35708 RepID=A0A0A9BB63_ARUDO
MLTFKVFSCVSYVLVDISHTLIL